MSGLVLLSSWTSEPVRADGKSTQPLTAEELKSYQDCKTDTDCVYANNGCCDCVNGGEAIAVHKDRIEKFKQRFSCRDIVCTMRGAVPACDSGKARCEKGLCRYSRGKPAM